MLSEAKTGRDSELAGLLEESLTRKQTTSEAV